MKDIFPDLDLWQSQGEEIALATLVQVRRSAPRPPGARLCITRSGRMSGSVSGGCVEADVFERAMQVLDSRNPEVANYGIADEMGFEVGLSCGGSIDVFHRTIRTGRFSGIRCAGLWSVSRQFVYAIGLAPEALLGRKLTRVIDGRAVGSIDPSLDGDIAAEGDRLLRTGGTKVVTLPWRGGEAQVFVEVIRPSPHPIDRRGHPRRRLPVPPRHRGGFQVTVIDARSALATPERFPDAERLIHAWPDEALAQAPPGRYTSLVVLTHDPKFDVPTLASALQSETRYIGAQGSRVTHERRKKDLRQQGFSDADLARIRGSHWPGYRVSNPCRACRGHSGRGASRAVRPRLKRLRGGESGA